VPNRFIKETICKSETLDKLTAEEERLFYRLIVNCDDYGRFDSKPSIVKNSCYRLDEGKIKIDSVGNWINKLRDVGLITLYENHGKTYLEFKTWHEHQQIRSTRSKYPGSTDEDSKLITTDIKCYQLQQGLTECDRTRIRNTYPVINLLKEKGGMGEKEKTLYAEFVSLTNAEHNALVTKLTEEGAKRCIEILDNYKGSSGRKYKSDYRTILNWVVQRYEEEKRRNKPQQSSNIFSQEDV
jgi:hypothetical protein